MFKSNDILEFIPSEGPIRVGCFVRFYRKSNNTITEGYILRSTYADRSKKNHIYIIQRNDESLLMENATRLYSCLIHHIPGEISKQEKQNK